jgi:predicted nucleotidyltransferase
LNKNEKCKEILDCLSKIKGRYEKEGFFILGIFGSFARGDFDEQSDIDIAYKLDKKTFFEKFRGFSAVSRIAEIAQELRSFFGKKVDLCSFDSGNESLRSKISREIIDA